MADIIAPPVAIQEVLLAHFQLLFCLVIAASIVAFLGMCKNKMVEAIAAPLAMAAARLPAPIEHAVRPYFTCFESFVVVLLTNVLSFGCGFGYFLKGPDENCTWEGQMGSFAVHTKEGCEVVPVEYWPLAITGGIVALNALCRAKGEVAMVLVIVSFPALVGLCWYYMDFAKEVVRAAFAAFVAACRAKMEGAKEAVAAATAVCVALCWATIDGAKEVIAAIAVSITVFIGRCKAKMEGAKEAVVDAIAVYVAQFKAKMEGVKEVIAAIAVSITVSIGRCKVKMEGAKEAVTAAFAAYFVLCGAKMEGVKEVTAAIVARFETNKGALIASIASFLFMAFLFSFVPTINNTSPSIANRTTKLSEMPALTVPLSFAIEPFQICVHDFVYIVRDVQDAKGHRQMACLGIPSDYFDGGFLCPGGWIDVFKY